MLGFRSLKPARRVVRLSRAGMLFVGFTLVVGLAAVNTGNNLLFLLVSMMLALMTLSGLAALANVGGVRVELLPGQLLDAQAGGPLLFRLDNSRAWSAWLLELHLGPEHAVLPRLPAHTAALLSVSCPPLCRGLPPLPQVLLGSSFPFAFVWRGRTLDPGSEETGPWVAPAPAPQGIPLADYADPGRICAGRAVGSFGDVLGARPWNPPEPLQRICWRRSDWSLGEDAMPRLPVLERENESGPVRILDYDSPSLAGLDTEIRLEHLRTALDGAAAAGAAWILRTGGVRMAGHGQDGKPGALMALARHRPYPGYPSPEKPRPGWWKWGTGRW